MIPKYTPVVTKNDELIMKYNPDCFINYANNPPTPELLDNLNRNPFLLSDSGGFQIYKSKLKQIEGDNSSRVVVRPGAGYKKRKGLLILDPLELCSTFGTLNVDYGFTLDFPIVTGTDEEYKSHLEESFKWAQFMLHCGQKRCPNTNLLIPLHFSNKEQLHDYFYEMDTLNPEGYSFSVRGLQGSKYLMKVTYILTFLYSEGVKKVHILGTSTPEIIVVEAAALALKMFQQVTFDSRTWANSHGILSKQLLQNSFRQIDMRDLKKYHLLLPNDLSYQIEDYMGILPHSYINKLLQLSNVRQINLFTHKMANMALDIDRLKNYVLTDEAFGKKGRKVKDALNLLQFGYLKGYKAVEKYYNRIWY